MSDEGWFAGLDPDDVAGAAAAVREGSAEAPADWPALAVTVDVAGIKRSQSE